MFVNSVYLEFPETKQKLNKQKRWIIMYEAHIEIFLLLHLQRQFLGLSQFTAKKWF